MKFYKSNPIEIYVSNPGYLVFKNYDISIVLTPEQAKHLLHQLPSLIELQEKHWTGIEEE